MSYNIIVQSSSTDTSLISPPAASPHSPHHQQPKGTLRHCQCSDVFRFRCQQARWRPWRMSACSGIVIMISSGCTEYACTSCHVHIHITYILLCSALIRTRWAWVVSCMFDVINLCGTLWCSWLPSLLEIMHTYMLYTLKCLTVCYSMVLKHYDLLPCSFGSPPSCGPAERVMSQLSTFSWNIMLMSTYTLWR